MRMVRIEADVLMIVGDFNESVTTASLCGSDAWLVDTLADLTDAGWMHRCLAKEMVKTGRMDIGDSIDDTTLARNQVF